MEKAIKGFGERVGSSVRMKLLLAFAAGVVLIAASAVFGFTAARNGLQEIRVTHETQIMQAFAALELKSNFKIQVQEWKDTILRGYDDKLFAKYWGAFQKKEAEVQKDARSLAKKVTDPRARDLLQQFVVAHKEMGEKYREGLKEFERSSYDAHAGDLAVRGIDRQPTQLLEQAYEIINNNAMHSIHKVEANAEQRLIWAALGMALCVMLAVIVASSMLLRMVVRPVVGAARIANRVADGDLTVDVRITSRDEVGQLLAALARMRDRLAQSVTAIRRTADSVSVASKEIASSNSELSSRTEEEASSIEETAASMEELTVTVKQNGEHAKRAKGFALETSTIATRGGEAMQKVVKTMDEIADSSKRIAEIIGVIDSIAFQTNILALNAAVEAARAGEQGRGFAVVASEVRSLAQRSAAAAREIKDLITDSTSKVDAGSHQVNDAGRTMQEIVASVKQVTDLIAEINAAGQEQSQGIEQVSETISQLEKVTQQNAAMVEQASAAAGSLEEQARLLLKTVAAFRLADGAATEPAPAAVPVRKPAVSPALARPKAEPHKPHFTALASKTPAWKGNGEAKDGWQEF